MCDNDLHICKNCEFYDTKSYHDCRESNAEYVTDKEKSNMCDYFKPAKRKKSTVKKSQDARRKLEELFKK